MTTEAMFEMLHGMAVDALERMEAERDALRARAEAAEQRAEALAAELAQARADARVLAGIAYGLEECCWVEDRLAPAGLTDAEADALRGAFDAAYRLPDAEVVAVIRRTLGGAA